MAVGKVKIKHVGGFDPYKSQYDQDPLPPGERKLSGPKYLFSMKEGKKFVEAPDSKGRVKGKKKFAPHPSSEPYRGE